jgi:hypothetical protein
MPIKPTLWAVSKNNHLSPAWLVGYCTWALPIAVTQLCVGQKGSIERIS